MNQPYTHRIPIGTDAFSLLSGEGLMDVFDQTQVLDEATKEKIRHIIWARLKETEPSLAGSGSDVDVYIFVGGLAASLLAAPVLAVLWTQGFTLPERLGAAALAVLLWFGSFLAISDRGIGRLEDLAPDLFAKAGPAIYLSLAALAVLGVSGLTSADFGIVFRWVLEGLRAGLVAAAVVLGGPVILWVGALLRERVPKKNWSVYPEANIMSGLLRLLRDFAKLTELRIKRDELIVASIASNRRREELVQGILAARDGREISQTTQVGELPGGTSLETYLLETKVGDGPWETVLQEERNSLIPDVASVDAQVRVMRRRVVDQIEEVANYISFGLFGNLSVGRPEVDGWLRGELQQRAQTVKNWAHRVLLLDDTSGHGVLAIEVGQTLQIVAEERWEGMPKSQVRAQEPRRSRLLRLARGVSVGAVPLAAVIAVPAVGIQVPGAVRDAVLTFAVPWLLLQLLELMVPGGSAFLLRSKELRDLLPSPIGRALGR